MGELTTLNWTSLSSAIMFVGTVLAGASAILLWIYRELNNIRESQNRLHVKLVEEFVSFEILRKMEDRFEASILRVETRLDRILEYIKLEGSKKPA